MKIKKLPMPSLCAQLQKEYQAIQTLKAEFDLAYEKAIKTGNLKPAKVIKKELEKKREALREKLWPFEFLNQEKLKEQYQSQKEILRSLGILEKLTTGDLGIKAIDNHEYRFPEYSEIVQALRKNKEVVKTKSEQGFNQLLITPFGRKHGDLVETTKQVILRHHQGGKLFATKKNPEDPAEKLEPLPLDTSEPVWVWDEYPNADTEGKLVYYPKQFSQDPKEHQGKTKQDLLQQTKQGFNVLLVEDLANIPREGQGKTITNKQGQAIRKQLEANQTATNTLKLCKKNLNTRMNSVLPPKTNWLTSSITLNNTTRSLTTIKATGLFLCSLAPFFLLLPVSRTLLGTVAISRPTWVGTFLFIITLMSACGSG